MVGTARRRLVAALLSAVAVAGVAVAVVLLLHRRDSPSRPSALARHVVAPGPVHGSADPHAAAVDTAREIIAASPAPPEATRVDRAPLTALNTPGQVPGAQHVEQTRFWTSPGTVEAAISYLTAHPPAGMRMSGSGSAGGPVGPTTQMIVFDRGAFVSLQYGVVPYRGGVAVRADAQVLWAPLRSSADVVPSPVRSVSVLVVRQNPQLHRSAPTVRRTLTGDAARMLAADINRLPLPVPAGPRSCPMIFSGVRLVDQLVFHGGSDTAQVRVDLAGCSSATFSVGRRKPIELGLTDPGARTDINAQILSALGLPADYGDH